ncbi:Protein FecR [uncultured Comamonas sp.]|nr:Protein FecR [uncultured Comamonas sp.]
MNTSPTTPSHDAMEQAAAWFSLLQSGAATDADRARWQDWLASSADQRAAWAFVERVSQRFQPLYPHADTGTTVPRLAADALQAAASNRRHRRTVLGIAAMAGTGGLLGWAAWGQSGAIDALLAWSADHRTATGQRREVHLPDGTQVWLGSASAFNQDYDARLRRLRLHGGEILIQTATDADRRPFVVDTPQGRMQALGTHFNVRLDEDGRTQLAVYQGAVQVTLAHSAESATIGAGQQLGFSARRLDAPTPADPARQAWARGILLAQDIPLGQVIAELARYQRGHIAVAPEVAGLTVLGSYPLDDVDGTLSMLQQTLPIQVRHPLPWWTTIEARGR